MLQTETEDQKLRGLRSVRVEKEKLLDIVRKNRDEHRTIFEEAIEGWKKRVTQALEEMVEDARRGKDYRLHVGLVRPEDHTTDYDNVIAMLELSLDDELELTAGEFNTYVRDEWGWQQTFAATTTPYSTTAQGKFSE